MAYRRLITEPGLNFMGQEVKYELPNRRACLIVWHAKINQEKFMKTP